MQDDLRRRAVLFPPRLSPNSHPPSKLALLLDPLHATLSWGDTEAKMEAEQTMARCHGVLIRSAIVVVIAAVVIVPLFG